MTRDLLRHAGRLVDAAVARLESGDPIDTLDPVGLPSARSGQAVDRRRFLARGTASLAALLAGSALAACDRQGPAAAQRLLRTAERKNEAVERWIFRHSALDRPPRGARAAGASFPAYHVAPAIPTWDAAARGEWTLEVSGLVRRPLRFTLDELLRLPHIRQRVEHFCVEGWSAVATFTGVRVADLLRMAGPLPHAQYADFQSFERDPQVALPYHESWDLESATHPQTLVVYGKDGQFLSAAYGAPARVHSPVKLGYKNTKYLTRIELRAERNGGYWSDLGYEWYGGT